MDHTGPRESPGLFQAGHAKKYIGTFIETDPMCDFNFCFCVCLIIYAISVPQDMYIIYK